MICVARSSFAKFMVKDGIFEKPVCTYHSIKYRLEEGLTGRPLTASERESDNGW